VRNVWVVFRREYLQRVRSRWFLVATLGGPILLVAAVLFSLGYGAGEAAADRPVAVVDRTGVLGEAVADRLEEGGLVVLRTAPGSDPGDAVGASPGLDGVSGYLLLDDATLRSGDATWYGREPLPPLRALTFRQAVVAAVLEERLGGDERDAAALLAGGRLRTEVLGGASGGTAEGRFLLGFAGAFLLYTVILLYAVAVMRATLEEKTSRVVEVIVSAMEPWHLMLGKVLGVGAVGLTQLAVWVAAVLALVSSGLPLLAARRPELAELGELGALAPGPGLTAGFVGLFLFGYFIYSGLYAAVGAMCSSDEEAQQAQLPVMILVVAPMILLPPVVDAPASTLATVLSLVPFFTPVLLWPRMAAGATAVWEVALAFLLMGVTIVVVARIAGRIYKVGILMAGKRPSLRELWRWIREA
jgi:ABC-2 type transport system permease protein